MSSDENAGAETEADLNIKLPQKRYYRQRAHANPIADHSFIYPVHPAFMDWRPYYPEVRKKHVEMIDVGCGYGGFLVALSTLFPDTLSLGFEIRVKVSDYVMDRIMALRGSEPGKYQNIACIRTNAMKYLPNYFYKAQLTKMFFLYPDPHFKKSKYKRRIINRAQLAEYAYVLRSGGKIYTITDVEDLHSWMLFHLSNCKLFVKATELELKEDPVVQYLFSTSEEGMKVTRNNGSKHLSVFIRI